MNRHLGSDVSRETDTLRASSRRPAQPVLTSPCAPRGQIVVRTNACGNETTVKTSERRNGARERVISVGKSNHAEGRPRGGALFQVGQVRNQRWAAGPGYLPGGPAWNTWQAKARRRIHHRGVSRETAVDKCCRTAVLAHRSGGHRKDAGITCSYGCK